MSAAAYAQTEKARSSMNSLKHGLTSRRTVLPGENPAEFDALVSTLLDENNPIGTMEFEFVNSIASALWRLDRARGHEARVYEQAFGPRVLRYTASIERELHRSTIRLTQLRETRRKAEAARRRKGQATVHQSHTTTVGFVSSPETALFNVPEAHS